MSNLRAWIRTRALPGLIALFLFFETIGYFLLVQTHRAQFADFYRIVQIQRGYQGLILDASGVASLLISITEQTSGVFVREIEIQQAGHQALSRSFHPSGAARQQFLDVPGGRVVARFEKDGLSVWALLLLSVSELLKLSGACFGLALLLTAGALGYRFHQERERRAAIAVELSSLASQVSHDIRSPLAALTAILEESGFARGEQGAQVRSALNRIRDIANQLLLRYRSEASAVESPENVSPSEELATVHLPSFLAELIQEKRAELRGLGRSSVAVELELNQESYSLFSRIPQIEFGRALSNLLNNAIEAVPRDRDGGRVAVSVKPGGKGIVLAIEDNGIGIPRELIARIGERGFSHGKAGCSSGTGLGVFHARSRIEELGGELKILSEAGKGTRVEITLPCATVPEWFLASLSLNSDDAVACVGLDPEWVSSWKLKAGTPQAQVFLEFESRQEFVRWYRQYTGDWSRLGVICRAGLEDLVDLAGPSRGMVVVDSLAEGLRISESRKSSKFVPSGMASWIPIRVS